MKKIVEKKRVTLTFTKIVLDDGYEFGDAYALLELLEGAYDTDGYFTRIVVYNEWGKRLEELGVLSGSSRGSYSCGKNFISFWDEVHLLVYGTPREK
jgi:hypothetical protein